MPSFGIGASSAEPAHTVCCIPNVPSSDAHRSIQTASSYFISFAASDYYSVLVRIASSFDKKYESFESLVGDARANEMSATKQMNDIALDKAPT